MPNEKLLATLQETLREIVEARNQRILRLQEENDAVNNAESNLKVARERERIAVHKDEDAKTAMRELTDHLNGLANKPQSLLDKLTRLGLEQLTTYRQRGDQGEIVRRRQRELADAQTRLTIAQMDLQTSDKDVGEIDEQIREVQSRK